MRDPRFPHTETLEVEGTPVPASRIVEILAPLITDRRRELIDEVIARRTYSVVPVLDGIYDRGNISACMRSAEAMGFQAMHVIERYEGFKAANRVTQGADKWLDVTRWSEPSSCVADLRQKGYAIVATHLEASRPIAEIDFTTPTALVFGNERDGVCDEILEAADARVIIPMDGFSQSFNISVAAAISLYHVAHSRRQGLGHHGDLTGAQQAMLTASYYTRTVKHWERVVARALEADGAREDE